MNTTRPGSFGPETKAFQESLWMPKILLKQENQFMQTFILAELHLNLGRQYIK